MASLVAALEPLAPESFLLPPPQAVRSKATQAKTATFRVKRFIKALLQFCHGEIASVAERPYSEIVLDALPEPSQPSGLEQQERDDDDAEQQQLDRRELADQELERSSLESLPDALDVVGDPRHEGGPVDGTGDGAEAADDDHGHEQERDVDV